MRLQIRLPQVLTGVAVAGLAAVGAAVATQAFLGMLPCPWCVFQRLMYVLVAVLALLAAWGPKAGRLPLIGLALVADAWGLGAALWQQFYASKSPSCDMTLADRVVSGLKLDGLFPDVFMALASCADATVPLLGVSYAAWSALLFTALGATLVWALRFVLRARRRWA